MAAYGSSTLSRVVRVAVNTKLWNPTEAEWCKALSCINPQEKERINGFMFKRDAKHSMVGRLLIRSVVGNILERSTNEIKLVRTRLGRPIIEDGSTLRLGFNIAHNGDYTIIAADNHKIGCDIMKIQLRNDKKFFNTMRGQLTPEEWDIVESQPDEREKFKMFYRYWCLKESYLKAMSVGLTLPTRDLKFHINTEDPYSSNCTTSTTLNVGGVTLNRWVFEECLLDEDHCVAVARKLYWKEEIEGGACSQFQFWSPQELLAKCDPFKKTDSVAIQKDWIAFSQKEECPNITLPS